MKHFFINTVIFITIYLFSYTGLLITDSIVGVHGDFLPVQASIFAMGWALFWAIQTKE